LKEVVQNFKNPRIVFAFAYDAFIAAFSFFLALSLRYETLDYSKFQTPNLMTYFVLSEVILISSFFVNGLYQGVWRFSSTHDLLRVIKASASGLAVTMLSFFYLSRIEGMPRSIFLIQFFILIVGLGGGRFFYRFLKDRSSMKHIFATPDDEVRNVLIIGAGRAGEKLVRDINATPKLKLKVVGFVDDNRFIKNAMIHNVKVFGGSELIPTLVNELNVNKIFIAIPSATGEEVKHIVKYCNETNAEVKILPRTDHVLSSKVEISLLRNLNIEDLLGREPVILDLAHLSSMLYDKVILVTGAGGSIGSELCYQIAKFQPKLIVMADICELFMYELEMKFKEKFPDVAFFPKIVDVRNLSKVNLIFETYKPQIVFHAAAYKHVPMMEYNPGEAVETNIKGTKIIAEAAIRHGSDKFIMISTDKAVNPTNVMGASKRIAEMIITSLSNRNSKTKFISVRFGNVLGSNGSVIPLFTKQIEARKDITVTHPDIIRYFMSIPEACQLVLQAGSMGEGGEIFVLDMGEPVKIVDLAKEMVRLAGLQLNRDIKIVYTGLRPGEKLYEELFSEDETFEFTHHGKIRKARYREIDPYFDEYVERLINLKTADPSTIVHLIKELIPEFTHFRIKPAMESSFISAH